MYSGMPSRGVADRWRQVLQRSGEVGAQDLDANGVDAGTAIPSLYWRERENADWEVVAASLKGADSRKRCIGVACTSNTQHNIVR